MALLYQAELSPSKIELLTAWVPAQPWLGGADASRLKTVGAYRFDDPEGEVGIETHLLCAADGQLRRQPGRPPARDRNGVRATPGDYTRVRKRLEGHGGAHRRLGELRQ